MKNFLIWTLHKILLGLTGQREEDVLEIIIGKLEGWKPLGK
jgi:hypothetical protein